MRLSSTLKYSLLTLVAAVHAGQVTLGIEFGDGTTVNYTPPWEKCHTMDAQAWMPAIKDGTVISKVTLDNGNGEWGFKLYQDAYCKSVTWEKDIDGNFQIMAYAGSWSVQRV